MTCLRLLSLSGLLYVILACPAQAQVLTGGPYRVGDTVLNNGVAEQVIAGPFSENHARSQPTPPSHQPLLASRPGTPSPVQPGPPQPYPHVQPVPAYPPAPSYPPAPPYQPLPPAPYPPAPRPPVPSQPAASDDDDSDPNCCLRPGSELWEQMVDLIRENARLEATVGKLEEVNEIRLDAANERTARLVEELKRAEHRLEAAEQASQIKEKEQRIVDAMQSLEKTNQALKQRLEQMEQKQMEQKRMEDAQPRKAAEQKTAAAKEMAEQRFAAARKAADQAAAAREAAKREVEKLKALLQMSENETAEKMEAAAERTADLEKQLSTTKHHLDEAREREQAWSKERQQLQREISELKKRRK